MKADDERHGTEAGHEQHCRDDEDPCAPCYRAKILASRRRNKRKTMGHKYTVPAEAARERLRMWRDGGATYGEIADHTGVEESRIWEILNSATPLIYTRTANSILRVNGWPITAEGITRRVRALCRLGWSIPKIAEVCGVHHDTILDIRRRRPEFVSRRIRAGIIAGYDAAAMTIPQATDARDQAGITRARNYAEKQGWAAPLAWQNIDDPAESPRSRPSHARQTDIDPVVVERSLAGDILPTTRAEKIEITRRWEAQGRSLNELERTFGWKSERYTIREVAAS